MSWRRETSQAQLTQLEFRAIYYIVAIIFPSKTFQMGKSSDKLRTLKVVLSSSKDTLYVLELKTNFALLRF